MSLKMFDLAGADDGLRFSPYCWRIRMALAHKGLNAETIPWRFTEKDAIANSGQGAVPVLQDGERMISDSWDIACYLEEKYPDTPTLFGGTMSKGQTLFLKYWVETNIVPALIRIIILDIVDHIHPDDRDYFMETRSKRFGKPLAELADHSPEQIKRLHDVLQPARLTLGHQDFICGDRPGFADYILFAHFQFARCISPKKLLDSSDPVYGWRDRMLNLFDGLAVNAKGYPIT